MTRKIRSEKRPFFCFKLQYTVWYGTIPPTAAQLSDGVDFTLFLPIVVVPPGKRSHTATYFHTTSLSCFSNRTILVIALLS